MAQAEQGSRRSFYDSNAMSDSILVLREGTAWWEASCMYFWSVEWDSMLVFCSPFQLLGMETSLKKCSLCPIWLLPTYCTSHHSFLKFVFEIPATVLA
jgi:hypothetical protein